MVDDSSDVAEFMLRLMTCGIEEDRVWTSLHPREAALQQADCMGYNEEIRVEHITTRFV